MYYSRARIAQNCSFLALRLQWHKGLLSPRVYSSTTKLTAP